MRRERAVCQQVPHTPPSWHVATHWGRRCHWQVVAVAMGAELAAL
jgi:hypothetical protein